MKTPNNPDVAKLPATPAALAPVSGSVARARVQRYIVGFGPEEYTIKVQVMAVVDRYAMVRRKGCSPFVIETRRLVPLNAPDQRPGQ